MMLHLPKNICLKGKKKILSIFVIFSLLLSNATILKAQPFVHGTFTINSALPTDVGDPIPGTNFQSFYAAIGWLSIGVDGPVVFNVAAGSGPYVEQVSISNIEGTSPVNTVIFNGNGATIQHESINGISRAVIKFDNVAYVTLDNLKITAIASARVDSYGWGIGLLHNADNNVIKNCTVTVGTGNSHYGQNSFGIVMTSTENYPTSNGISDCDNNIIDNNTVIGGYDGIALDNYAGNVDISFTSMDNNQVTNNKISGFIHAGIHMLWNKKTLVQGNDISGVMVQEADGINIDVKNVGLKINANRIHHISADPIRDAHLTIEDPIIGFKAIDITDCIGDIDNVNTISNNLIYDITTTKSQQGIGVTSCSFVNVYNNTILLDGLAPVEIPDYDAVTNGLLSNYGNQNARFENNIVSVKRPGSKANAVSINDTEIAIAFDYNDIIGNATNFGNFGGHSYSTLPDWQLASSRDAHSTSQDPIFTDIAAGNYKPTSVAFDNLGTFVGITADINAEIRNNQNPDVGAYEFLTPPCSTPPIAGNAVIAPAVNVCGGSIRTLNLSGNSFGTSQTYKWQSSATGEAGTYTDISSGLVVPSFDVFPPNSTYYQAVVGCGGTFATSSPVLITASHPLTGSYTINSAAATTGNNFQSFADVLLALKCGISGPLVLNVAPGSGPYNEQVIFNTIDGVSANNTITLNGNGNTLSYLSTNYDERATLKLRGTDYMTIDNLTVTAQGSVSGQYGVGIQLMSGANHNVISNNKVNVTTVSVSANFSGIVVNSSNTDLIGSEASYCDNNKITGNTVTGGKYGISMYSDYNVAKIYNDTISNNTIKDMFTYGIYLIGTSHALIEGNDISRPTRIIANDDEDGDEPELSGIAFSNLNTSLLISKNRIHNPLGGSPSDINNVYGIIATRCDAPADSANVVSNNLLYGFEGLATQVGLYNKSSDNVLYYNNTISLDNTSLSPTGPTMAIYQTDDASGLEFRDNNILIKRSGTGTNHGIYIDAAGTSFKASNNNYFINGASANNNIGFISGASYATVAAWQAATVNDDHSLAINPNFFDAPNGNLLPQNLLLDNKGIPAAGILTDITGIARSTSLPDIGAYEFSGVLAVKLLDVTAIKAASDVVVSWATVTELSNKEFVIERSVTGTFFTQAGTKAAIGNSNTYQQYKFTDKNAALAATNNVLYYRLKMVGIDGNFEYSKIVKVQFDKTGQVIITALPNPFIAQLAVRVTTSKAGKALVQLSDITGRIISKQEQDITIGTTFISIGKASQLIKGVYLVSVEINGNKYATKVIK